MLHILVFLTEMLGIILALGTIFATLFWTVVGIAVIWSAMTPTTQADRIASERRKARRDALKNRRRN